MVTYSRAVLYMVFSAIAFTAVNTLIRSLDHLSTFQLVFFRSIVSLLLCIAILKARRIPYAGTNRRWLVARGVVGFVSLALFYWALKLMPIGTAVSLRYTSPFFAALLAMLFLGERMKGLQWIFFSVAFLGVVTLKGVDLRISFIAFSIILASALLSGTVYFIIRKIGTSEHPVVIVFYLMAISSGFGGLLSFFNWIPPKGTDWWLLLGVGSFGYLAQLFMTKALQMEKANRIVPFKYLEVIFTLLAGWIFFAESQSVIALLAISIIILGLLGNILVS